MVSRYEEIESMSVQELEELKYTVDETLKKKRGGKRKPKAIKKPEERKPSLNLKKTKYVEMQIREGQNKVKCYYVGVLGSEKAQAKIEELAQSWPGLQEEYKGLLEKNKSVSSS